MSTYRATLGGKVYTVVIDEIDESGQPGVARVPTAAMPLETAAMSLGPEPHVLVAASKNPGPLAEDPGAVLSPLAGKVVSLDVKVGETVTEGAQVVTIEAMKMNTYVFAPKSGRVVSIEAAPGDAVEEGACLLHLG
jgi:biotin carboxyl carrier protein